MREILLSMKPEWFNMVISGQKKYEYRKHFPNEPIRAYIYVSAPVKAVEAIIEFGNRIDLSVLKETCEAQEMKDRVCYYLKNNNYAIPVIKVFRINKISLDELREGVGGFIAPQMYYFLKEETALTSFLHDKVRIIGQPICDNLLEEISIDEMCKVFDESEVKKLRQMSLFDDPTFCEDNTINVLEEKKPLDIHPKLVSLFSGCGGMDLGFVQAGYNIIYANDFDSDAQRVYERNLGEIDKRSILDVDEREIPDCDILTAGFPCQPFSNAGNRKGVNDSRGNLYKECLRVIKEKLPKVVVFENVRGLLSTKDENGNPLIDTIVSNLDELGYTTNYKLVNASSYGVPQNRIRVIVVAFRKDLGVTFSFPEEQSKEGLNIGNCLDISEDIPNQVDWPFSPQAMNLVQHIPEGGSWKSIPYEYLPERFRKIRDNMKRYHAPNMYRRFARNEIAGTITASAQPENCGIIHPLENRRLNVREIARIQTFPDEFIFFTDDKKSVTGMYKVIGNAVPPKLAETIAREILLQIGDKFEKEE